MPLDLRTTALDDGESLLPVNSFLVLRKHPQER